jgi:putative oxidoreductase
MREAVHDAVAPTINDHAASVLFWLGRVPNSLIALLARFGIAGIFFRSGQTKVSGWEVTDSTFFLFAEEYRVPLLPPEVAAYMAAFAEHFFPVLLVIGLASRFSAASLLAMTLVIQIFVYPNLWPDHTLWAAAMVFVIARGPGTLSLDHLIARKFLDR